MYAARKGDWRPGKKNVMKPETHCEVIKDMIQHESLCVCVCVYYSHFNTDLAVHSLAIMHNRVSMFVINWDQNNHNEQWNHEHQNPF